MSMVKLLSEIKDPKVSELGGKGYSLAVLIKNGFKVPKGFIITSECFFGYLRENKLMEKAENLCSETNENNFQEKSKEIKKLILTGKVPEKIASKIKTNLAKLNVQYVSIRSSAVSEDSLKASFAGLHDTFLNVKAEVDLVLKNVKKCLASLFNERAVIYRLKKKIPLLEGMAVIIEEMIPSDVSGITFTVHPTNKRAILTEFASGFGDAIVSGKIIPNSIVINRDTLLIVERNFREKDLSIPNDRLVEIAKNSLKIENIFSSPQDIEWCISRNSIWFLQSRSITTPPTPIEEKTRRKAILNGLGASPGVAQGRVKIILSPKEVGKMNYEEILVTTMTNPLYVTAIQKAKAIVTDVGGMICHAAILARELGIPCVVGTKNSTKILKDNIEVVVDGTDGKVYISD